MRGTLAVLMVLALPSVPAAAQDAAPWRPHDHVAAAPAASTAAGNLNVPATDFSQLKPVLPAQAASGAGRKGGRRGGGSRLGGSAGF